MTVGTIHDLENTLRTFIEKLSGKTHDGLCHVALGKRGSPDPVAPEWKKSIDRLFPPNLRSEMIKRLHGQMKRPAPTKHIVTGKQIGRASCRERVCQYV